MLYYFRQRETTLDKLNITIRSQAQYGESDGYQSFVATNLIR